MNTQDFKRKLTAVFSADVAGYSRLMGEDESATVKTLEAYKQVMFSLIKQHRGRVIDSPGDNLLAEFASVVDAVQCGVAVQKELHARNTDLPENRRMQFRIGINLGDVIEEGERIYGDGVNIAARLEALADPGGICVSKTAFDHIETKLPLGYEFLGEQEVKNIAKPVGAYRVLMDPRVTVAGAKEKKPTITLWRRKGILAGAVALLVVIMGAAIWNFYLRSPKIEPASKEKMAFPLPDKPSIAVLAFTNMSGDPKDDLLGDGLAEGIINGLAKSERILVIARNSTFTYKGKPVKVKQVAEEMGVRYVIEGSVQKEGERVRITVQLIDALTGHHLFSERYDRDFKSLLDLQDEITMKVLTAVQVKLTGGEGARISAKGTKNLDAYLKRLQAGEQLSGTLNKERVQRSMQLSEEAIALDPEYADAYSSLGIAHTILVAIGASESPRESLRRSLELGKKAVALDEFNSSAHGNLAFTYIYLRDFEKALEEAEKAVTLGPNSAFAYWTLGSVFGYRGRPQEAIPYYQKSLRLSPIPVNSQLLTFLAGAYRDLGQYEEALVTYKKIFQLYGPDHVMAHLGLAAIYAMMGRENEARAEGAEVLRIDPKFSVERFMKSNPPGVRKDRLTEALLKAGLPEKPPLPLPDKPSIAVLPFVNMSEEKSQEYFSDGLTEEIITALSKTPKLFVIARNSTFVYKGKPVNVQQVSRDLGVKYVLEGSVRKSGNQLRITAQLIDATTGNHLWAERYDREMKDIFAIQDNITLEIMKALEVKLSRGEMQGKSTETLEAYLKILQVSDFFYQFNKESNVRARELAEEAIRLDPNFARAYYGLSAITHMDVMLGLSKSPKDSRMKAIELCQKATSLDDTLAGAYGLLGYLYVQIGEYEKGVEAGERAIEVGPNSADAHSMLAQVLNFSGRAPEALALNERAFRLNPVGPTTYYYTHASFSYILTGRYEDAVKITKQELSRWPNNVLAHARLVWALSAWGHDEEAKAAAQSVLRIDPKFSAKRLASSLNFKDPSVAPSYLEHMLKAGLPE